MRQVIRISATLFLFAELFCCTLALAFEEDVQLFGAETPSFSPNGTKIAFASNLMSGGNLDVFVVNADGTGLTRLTQAPEQESYPAWSPNGSEIAYEVHAENSVDKVMVMNANGSNAHAVTRVGDSAQYSPAWTPDGNNLVVDTAKGGNSDLMLITLQGNEVRWVRASKDPEMNANCSPDGEWVVYERMRDENGPRGWGFRVNIWKTKLADILTPAAQLTFGAYVDSYPRFSPNGSKIAFDRTQDGVSGSEIWTMNSDGSAAATIPLGSGDKSQPAWSPDGMKIAFVKSMQQADKAHYDEIWIANLDGSNCTQLTNLRSAYVPPP